MKIHLIIEIEPDGVKIRRAHEVAPVPAGAEVILANGEKVIAPGKRRGRPPKATQLPVPPIEPPTPPPVNQELSSATGTRFDPAFVKVLSTLPEPFTRRSVAVATGLDVTEVTLRFNRLKHAGQIEQPARELWKRTKNFGSKTPEQ